MSADANKITFEDWVEQHKPITNPDGQGGPNIDGRMIMFETYGKDLEFVKTMLCSKPQNVWTLLDDGEGFDLIVAGYHYVNRLGYFITEVPCKSERQWVENWSEEDKEESLAMREEDDELEDGGESVGC